MIIPPPLQKKKIEQNEHGTNIKWAVGVGEEAYNTNLKH